MGEVGDGSRNQVKALVTERVGPGTLFIPFHFSAGGRQDLLEKYPTEQPDRAVNRLTYDLWF